MAVAIRFQFDAVRPWHQRMDAAAKMVATTAAIAAGGELSSVTYFLGKSAKQAQVDAWNKGYYKCLGKKTAGGATGTASNARCGCGRDECCGERKHSNVAGAYFHFTDGRFTAWGKYSQVLVPNLAPKIATAAKVLDGRRLGILRLRTCECNKRVFGGAPLRRPALEIDSPSACCSAARSGIMLRISGLFSSQPGSVSPLGWFFRGVRHPRGAGNFHICAITPLGHSPYRGCRISRVVPSFSLGSMTSFRSFFGLRYCSFTWRYSGLSHYC